MDAHQTAQPTPGRAHRRRRKPGAQCDSGCSNGLETSANFRPPDRAHQSAQQAGEDPRPAPCRVKCVGSAISGPSRGLRSFYEGRPSDVSGHRNSLNPHVEGSGFLLFLAVGVGGQRSQLGASRRWSAPTFGVRRQRLMVGANVRSSAPALAFLASDVSLARSNSVGATVWALARWALRWRDGVSVGAMGSASGQRVVSVTSDTSGRQANRYGAYGEVPRPAETCRWAVRPPALCVDGPLTRAVSRSQLVIRAP